MPTVLILGGSYVGIRVAHSLLKTTAKSVSDLKVVLVTKNTHFYWNMASVRAVVPGQLKEEQYALPIAKGFEHYPEGSFELIIGSAEALDADAKTVTVKVGDAEQSLSYDQLVLATGSRYIDDHVPWKANGSYEEVAASIKHTQDRIAAAKEIIIAGAGATGVELAGEIGFEYGSDKQITLLAGGDQILGGDSIAPGAVSELKKLGVTIKTSARVANTSTDDTGKTEVALENGEKLTADLYLPTMGVVPNSEYVPAKFLNDKKLVVVDDMHRVGGATNVWAAGDIVARPKATFVIADQQATGLAKNLDLVLKDKNPTSVSLMPFEVNITSVGRSRGVGRLGVVKVFSYFTYMMKGKTLGVQRVPGWVNGSAF